MQCSYKQGYALNYAFNLFGGHSQTQVASQEPTQNPKMGESHIGNLVRVFTADSQQSNLQ
jgi:hypothetical protein